MVKCNGSSVRNITVLREFFFRNAEKSMETYSMKLDSNVL